LNGIRVDHDDGGAFKAAQVWGNWAARRITVEVIRFPHRGFLLIDSLKSG
jgi:hypothetical protein